MGQLAEWRKQNWVRIGTDGSIKGPCGTSKNKKNPDRCLPAAKARSLSKAERAKTARKKKRAGAKGKTVVANTKKAIVSMSTGGSPKKISFIARGCGKVMNNRRKKTTISQGVIMFKKTKGYGKGGKKGGMRKMMSKGDVAGGMRKKMSKGDVAGGRRKMMSKGNVAGGMKKFAKGGKASKGYAKGGKASKGYQKGGKVKGYKRGGKASRQCHTYTATFLTLNVG